MKKLIVFITIFVSLAVILLFFIISWWNTNTQPISSDIEEQRFVIARGASAERVANELYEQDLIRSPLVFKFYLQIRGEAGQIIPGEYDLSPSMNIEEIANRLKSGPDELWVTIPEGLRREQIPDIFTAALGFNQEEAAKFEKDFLLRSTDLEGFLYPDTYLFSPEVTGDQAVIRMKSTFDTLTEDMSEDIANSDYSLKEIITLASIVERETRTAEERPVVAGIFFNRLDIGMPLQADATVQYARDNAVCEDLTECELWEPVLRGDLEYYESQYNTYTTQGIPAGPIASPGITSIRAVVYPEENNYLFYLHDDTGQIHYGENIQQHNANKARYIDN